MLLTYIAQHPLQNLCSPHPGRANMSEEPSSSSQQIPQTPSGKLAAATGIGDAVLVVLVVACNLLLLLVGVFSPFSSSSFVSPLFRDAATRNATPLFDNVSSGFSMYASMSLGWVLDGGGVYACVARVSLSLAQGCLFRSRPCTRSCSLPPALLPSLTSPYST